MIYKYCIIRSFRIKVKIIWVTLQKITLSMKNNYPFFDNK